MKSTIYIDSFLSPIGYIIIQCTEKAIFSVSFSNTPPHSVIQNSFTEKCIVQIQEYFAGIRTDFSLEMLVEGTLFQRKVWQKCAYIGYGQICSYAFLAAGIEPSTCAIAVGQALKRNPLPILIPCHRVLSSKNKNIGYSGEPWRKDFLLKLEKNR